MKEKKRNVKSDFLPENVKGFFKIWDGLSGIYGEDIEVGIIGAELVISKISATNDPLSLLRECSKYLIKYPIGKTWERDFLFIEGEKAAEGGFFYRDFSIKAFNYLVSGVFAVVISYDYPASVEVVLPLGWWWANKPRPDSFLKNMAIEKALSEEKAIKPGIKFKAAFEDTVIWPHEPLCLAHEINVASENVGVGGALYFIDAFDGSVLKRTPEILIDE